MAISNDRLQRWAHRATEYNIVVGLLYANVRSIIGDHKVKRGVEYKEAKKLMRRYS
jgi:hypothetical protein